MAPLNVVLLSGSALAAIALAVAARGIAIGSPARDRDGICVDRPGRPAADLYCMELVPAPDLPGASGMAELGRVRSPFGITATADGGLLHDLAVTANGLPDPATLGPYGAYIAWVTTPLLRPMVKLGEVRPDRPTTGRVGFDKFLVLVTAEPSTAVAERTGRIVLRGTSPSMRMQPHDLPFLIAGSAGGPRVNAGGHAGHGKHAEHGDAWIAPPMHPAVPMLPGMGGITPAVRPFLPGRGVAGPIPDAVPRRLVRLEDGDTLDLVAGLVRRTIRGRTFTMYGFNGQYPGPLIQVGQGATIVVDFTNRTGLPTAVHWHGIRLDNRFDGVPGVTQDPVPPGGRFRYRIHFKDAGIYWYHPHHREDIQQDLGLYGNVLVRSPARDYFGPANREEVLMLDDLLIADDGLVPWGLETATHALMGRFGNVMLVNGETGYRLAVRRGEVVRFFLTNVANTRTFNVSFGGAAMKVVASDIGKFEREEWVESVVIAPAERYVVDVRFDEPGEVALTNRVLGIDHLYGSFFPEVDTLGVVRVAEEPVEADHAAAFRHLRENDDVRAEIDRYRRHFGRPVDHELVLTLELGELPYPIGALMRLDSIYFSPIEWVGTMEEMNWVATGREVEWTLREPATGRENMDVHWRFRVGDVVKLRLTNNRHAAHAMQHPIHIHGQRFLILSQNGVPNDNLVWKDTILLPVGATADVLLELSNPGRWMLHCHIAEHLESGMRMVFDVEPATPAEGAG